MIALYAGIFHDGFPLEGTRARGTRGFSSSRSDVSGLVEERRDVARGKAALLKGEPVSTRGIIFFCRVRRTKLRSTCACTHIHTPNLALERILESFPPFGGSTKDVAAPFDDMKHSMSGDENISACN